MKGLLRIDIKWQTAGRLAALRSHEPTHSIICSYKIHTYINIMIFDVKHQFVFDNKLDLTQEQQEHNSSTV